MPDRSLQEEPTTSIIDRVRGRLDEIWSGARQQWREYDSYYFRTYPVWSGREAHDRPGWLKPSRPTSIIDSAVDHQLSAEPLFHRHPARPVPSEADKVSADRVEKGLKAIFDEASLEEPSLTWKQQGKNLIHLGYTVTELGLDNYVLQRRRDDPDLEGLSDEESKSLTRLHEHYRRTVQPFRTRSPHPSRILLDPYEKRPRTAIRHYRRFAQDIEDMVIARKIQGRKTEDFKVRNNQPFETFLIDEYWTEYYHAMMISGFINDSRGGTVYTYNSNQRRMLFIDRNTWGFVPYAHAYAGFGQEPTDADMIDPKYFAKGLLDSVMSDIKAQAQAIAGRHNALIEATFDKVGTRLGADELRDKLDQGDILGEMQPDDVWRIDTPNLQRWMFEVEGWYSSDIEQGTFSRALSGQREKGVTTVGQQAILSQAAGRKFVAVARQMEHLASVTGSQTLQLIDLLDLDLTIRGQRLHSGDIDSDYSVTASFDLVDPVLDLQKRQQAMAEVAAGLLSVESYWAESGREDATGEQTRLLMDFVRRNPLIHEAMALEVARQMGVEALLEQAIDMAKGGAAGGAAGGGGTRGSNGQSLIGPDGMPIDLTMGQDGGPARAAEELNGALTGDVPNPDRRGQNLAG